MVDTPRESSEEGRIHEENYEEALREARQGILDWNSEPAYKGIARFGPSFLGSLLESDEILITVQKWWELCHQGSTWAEELLERLGKGLTARGARPATFDEEERAERKRRQTKESQQRRSLKDYKEQFIETYQKAKRKLEKRKIELTPEVLRELGTRIRQHETSPQTGEVKELALKEFLDWIEEDIDTAMRKVSS